MHALGYRSISIHEYNAMTLDDDVFVININITKSGKQKLRLLLLASRASQPFQSAVINVSENGTSNSNSCSPGSAYVQMEEVRNTAGCTVWIRSHFPWLAAPECSYFNTYSHELYFGCLYEFLWTRYYHEFEFPPFGSVRYISDFDDDETLKELEFVEYLMDKYRFRIHQPFNVTKRKIIRWMNDDHLSGSTGNVEADKWLMSMWNTVQLAQNSICWTISEAERLNKLLMAEFHELCEEFMTEYVLAILGDGVFDINSQLALEEILFVDNVILRLIGFNLEKDSAAAMKLTEIFSAIRNRKHYENSGYSAFK